MSTSPPIRALDSMRTEPPAITKSPRMGPLTVTVPPAARRSSPTLPVSVRLPPPTSTSPLVFPKYSTEPPPMLRSPETVPDTKAVPAPTYRSPKTLSSSRSVYSSPPFERRVGKRWQEQRNTDCGNGALHSLFTLQLLLDSCKQQEIPPSLERGRDGVVTKTISCPSLPSFSLP